MHCSRVTRRADRSRSRGRANDPGRSEITSSARRVAARQLTCVCISSKDGNAKAFFHAESSVERYLSRYFAEKIPEKKIFLPLREAERTRMKEKM